MKNCHALLLLLLSVFAGPAAAQLPDSLDGDAARTWIRDNYYTGEISALTYSEARRKMFAWASNAGDSVECVYSGLKRYIARGDESAAYWPPFNTEHIVPQSLFSENEPMRSDMYILRPSYEPWNNLRGNIPFRDIDDQDTEQWIYLDQSRSTIPPANIDRYTEYFPLYWEPREGRKGDVARAIMYFFTMYPQFDLSQVIDTAVLCTWHETDAPDAGEQQYQGYARQYQGNLNPYIAYPQWANQAWGCAAVQPDNLPAAALDDEAFTPFQTAVNVDVAANDSDPDGWLNPFTVSAVTPALHGSVQPGGPGRLIYVPEASFSGVDSFAYRICDGSFPPGCDTAQVRVSVSQPLGLIDAQARPLAVYPNPSSGKFLLDLPDGVTAVAALYDVSGSRLVTRTVRGREEFHAGDLPGGLYWLVVSDGRGGTWYAAVIIRKD